MKGSHTIVPVARCERCGAPIRYKTDKGESISEEGIHVCRPKKEKIRA